ncbi:hypothetical protein HPB50_004310 [Hyalomma asiaticum]|uniref:Uncharacterized protein n=1 Tax=Hyalomma asiaticum TaxID=266040 RepID=A0ACB7RIY3_HYAAI|nr:hypothetical protein HPB50_004310 [Hyalomma asiaticum]
MQALAMVFSAGRRRTGFSFLALCIIWKSVSRVECTGFRNSSELWRLRNDLLSKGYDPRTRPATHGNDTTQVDVTLALVDGPYLIWTDHRLTWNAEEYGGQKKIYLKADDIWTPELYMMSTWSDVYSSVLKYVLGHVGDGGKVIMCTKASVQTFCKADMTHFPMDRHECVVEYSTILDPAKDVNLTIGKMLTAGVENSEFQLESVIPESVIKDYEEYGSYSAVVYRFVLKRRNLFHHFTILIPTVGVVVLSLMTLWLPPLSDRRFIVSAIVLSANVLVSALTIVATVANMNLMRFLAKVKALPPLVGKAVGLIATGVPLLCPGPKASTESTASSVDDIARTLTRALDRVYFVACLIAFGAIIAV